MANVKAEATVRSDEAILEDVRDLLRSYDPLRASEETLTYDVRNGVIRIRGYVENIRAHDILMNNLPKLDGVVAVNDDGLYDDERLMFEVAKHLPLGVRIRVQDGVVNLMGRPSDDVDVDELILELATIPGVDKIVNFIK